jgi:hypothetical protein
VVTASRSSSTRWGLSRVPGIAHLQRAHRRRDVHPQPRLPVALVGQRGLGAAALEVLGAVPRVHLAPHGAVSSRECGKQLTGTGGAQAGTSRIKLGD